MSPTTSANRPVEASKKALGEQRPRRVSGWRSTFDSLANRDFRLLWLGMLFIMGGVQMQMIVRGYLAYDITSSPFLLGLVSAGFALPMLSLALFGGAVADRLERKRVIQMGQAAVGAIALFIGVAITTETITWVHLLVESMLQGALFSFLMPARQAFIPQIVGRDMLTNAMAMDAAAMSATTLVGPAVAGVLYALVGPDVVYYIISGMGFAAVFITELIPKMGGGPAKSSTRMIADIKDGLSYIRGSPLVLTLLVMGLATALLAMPFMMLMPVFVVDVYDRGPDALGLMVSVMGIGSLAGSLFIASMGRWRRGLLLILGSFLSGIGLLLVTLIPIYFAAVGFMVMLGLGDSGRRTLNQTILMETVEDRYRGRVMSVFMMNYGLMPLGVLPAGIIAEFLGGRVAIGMLAVSLLIVSTLFLTTQRTLREVT